jgi:hypothetical protein
VTTIAARAVAIGTALAEHEDLPYRSLIVGYGNTIGVPTFYGSKMEGLREVAAWAQRFNTEIVISLSSGEGRAQTNVELGGLPVCVDVNFGTAQAYELGRILQRELNRDVSIHIGADELLAAIDQVVAP